MTVPSYEFSPTVLSREVEGEMVLLDVTGEQYFGLDPIGADIVTRLTRQPYDDAVQELLATYDVPPEVLTSDIRGLVDELTSAGLLVERAG